MNTKKKILLTAAILIAALAIAFFSGNNTIGIAFGVAGICLVMFLPNKNDKLLPKERRNLSDLMPKMKKYPKWGFFDDKGNEIISVEGDYRRMLPFNEFAGLAPANPINTSNGTWVFIDETGKKTQNQEALKAVALDKKVVFDSYFIPHSAVKFITDQQFLKEYVYANKDDGYLAECAVNNITYRDILREIVLSDKAPVRAQSAAIKRLKGDNEFLYQYVLENETSPLCVEAKQSITVPTVLYGDDFMNFDDFSSLDSMKQNTISKTLSNEKQRHKDAGNTIEIFFCEIYTTLPQLCRTQLKWCEAMRAKGENPDDDYLSDIVGVFCLRGIEKINYDDKEGEESGSGYKVLNKNNKEVMRIHEWHYREDRYELRGSSYSDTVYSEFLLEVGNYLLLNSSKGSYFSADGGDTWCSKSNSFSQDGGESWGTGVFDIDIEKVFAKDCSPKLIKI